MCDNFNIKVTVKDEHCTANEKKTILPKLLFYHKHDGAYQ